VASQWPYVWGEPSRIREIRRQVQKPLEKEELWAWLTIRRVSIYISLILSRFPAISPNLVTSIAVVLCFVASLWIVSANNAPGLAVALVYNLVYLLDCVDGELARLTDRCSRMGLWLDEMLGFGLMSMSCALTYRVCGYTFAEHRGILVVILVYNSLATVWLTRSVDRSLGLRIRHVSHTSRKSIPILDSVTMIAASGPGLFVGIAVIDLVPKHHQVYASALWCLVHLGTGIAKNVWRLRWVLRQKEE